MKSIKEIRKNIYEDNRRDNPYMFDKWKWFYYRKLKAILYMEGATLFAYLFLKMSVHPNIITLIYLLMGIFGGILIAIPDTAAIAVGLVFFYFRGIFDWTDGPVARITKKTSINGTVMDSYGALVGWVSLWTGLGFYLGHSTATIFYYLTPVIPALFAADLYANARETIIYHHILRDSRVKSEKGSISKINSESKIRKIKNFIDSMFEHNARTVDFIVFLIIAEMLTPLKLVWIVYSVFLVWQIIIFTTRLLIITRGGWAENQIEDLKKNIYD